MKTPFDDLIPLVERQYRHFGRETPLDGLLLNRAEGAERSDPIGLSPVILRRRARRKTQHAWRSNCRYRAGQGLLASIKTFPSPHGSSRPRRIDPIWPSVSPSTRPWSRSFWSNNRRRWPTGPPSRR